MSLTIDVTQRAATSINEISNYGDFMQKVINLEKNVCNRIGGNLFL